MRQWKHKLFTMIGAMLLILTLALTGCAGDEAEDEGVVPGVEQEENMGEDEVEEE